MLSYWLIIISKDFYPDLILIFMHIYPQAFGSHALTLFSDLTFFNLTFYNQHKIMCI